MASTPRIGVFNMTLPPEGPITVPFNVDMAAVTEFEIDMTAIIDAQVVSFISGAWIDNSANNQILTLNCNGTGQVINIPANKQAFMPLLLPNPPVVVVSQPAFGGLVKLIFTNFPVFPYVF